MQKSADHQYKAVVIGVSTGGVAALKHLLGALPAEFPIPVLVVIHIAADSDDGLATLLNTLCAIRVKEADEQERLTRGTVYLAPANYHLLVERGDHLALSIDPPVNFSRPSVDVLFEAAADVYGSALIGIILTGAGTDGSRGLLHVQNCGGLTIVQDPADAEMDSMPRSALHLLNATYILPLSGIPPLLLKFGESVD